MPFLAAIQVCAPSGVLDLLAANVDMNRKVAAANGGEMKVQSIDWASWSSTDISHGELDWIVGSDVTYDRRDWHGLIKMITALSTPQTRVRCCRFPNLIRCGVALTSAQAVFRPI